MQTAMTRWIGVVLALLFTGLTMTAAHAEDLDTLRTSGAVVERWDGYLEVAAASAGDSEVQRFVDRVNAQRQRIYDQRAAENGVSQTDVARLYAAEILENAPRGTRFKAADGTVTAKP